ncbi:MAG: alpha/beta fold hydrolase [Parvibaculum sp.]|uniref:alpha/beta fold hydrolase n=1 Tax=Parvibaculum sp. TaxID=2024848 RepID=UPI00273145FC|nr:alpha/beta fold hydrolase [Parvibaculum sp.]MDP1627155.1 alpha/beta fold hydrolase [Parvibaculum sp.]MDP2148861.1 alpha/beta fold hydrolase [Parvibaculum sp.]
MAVFSSGGVEIAYEVAGEGYPILLVHGFAATADDNWGRTGWVQALTRAKRKVVTFDLRGHGASAKLYDPADYTMEKMAGDAVALLDHLGIERADLIGYSMGAGIAMRLAATQGARFRFVVLGGVGGRMLEPSSFGAATADALEAADPETIGDRTARGFRLYAEGLGQDLRAIAACARAPRGGAATDFLGEIRNETLVIAGARDDMAGDPAVLAARIPGAKAETIPGTDHMFALPNPMFKGAVMDFLTGYI